MTLNDFIRRYVDPNFLFEGRNVMMEVFARRPETYVTDPGLRGAILSVPECQKYALRAEVIKLMEHRLGTLQHWKGFEHKEIVFPITRTILQSALDAAEANESATRILAVGRLPIPDGFYDSVLNAQCSHALEFHEGEGSHRRLRMKVKAGQPPTQLWDYTVQGRTLLPVEDAEQFIAPRPRLMILTSKQMWPYSLEGEPLADCYVNREVQRVWRIVERDLTEWFTTREGELQGPMRRLLIGTPGIGKCMNVGSYLLYQLLRYGDTKLKVVVYSFGIISAYVFDRTTKKVTNYEGAGNVRRVLIALAASGMDGFIIYDAFRQGQGPTRDFPPVRAGGIIVLTSPSENNYKGWAKQRDCQRQNIVNCPD
ncbi:retrotransposon hot spot (RHS) protein [Trypanosoma conorhini]|uniref:Retrotransposon hot spot (RHS) protein n=1 Tax=Trypanosoma conorhini TaxID=83891 RepID=A0A422MRI4_9TRYP|nr:retrotransposon hot spot (RHS) protein [Trypanosoma conorhini]RNE95842.1 retrotransposon hot spot (RHS) protein [Trypanosoma conorhini]